MNTLSLTPLFRHSVGFDNLNQLIDRAFSASEPSQSYPPYNIEKLGEDHYRIVMAVAGFKLADINILAHGNQLTVSARGEEKVEEDVTYLHKGIANRAFERKFHLADYVKVTNATLEDGLLTISLFREVPEAQKPRLIEITGSEKKRQGKLTEK